MVYSLNMDIYFWMIERAGLKDDSRNTVEVEKSSVTLHRDHGNRLDNGVFIGTLL